MLQYILRRLVWTVVTIAVIIAVTFLITYAIPSDPARVIAGPHATPETLASIRAALGLNKPLLLRLVLYFGQVLQGDLGYDWVMQQPVLTMILQSLPPTVYLALAAVVCELLIAIPIGVVAAVRRNSWIDQVTRTASLVGVALPVYWVGSLLLLYLGYYAGLFPLGGYSAAGVVLPALSVGVTGAAVYVRILRSSMLEVMRLDYVRTARAKGLAERAVIWRHIFRNALIPVVTYLGMDLGYLLGGLVVTEYVFNWPGLGLLLNHAIGNVDGALIMGLTMFSASAIVVMNLVVDIVYAFLDPRISYA
ncbi:MAG: ABC transporter permease [Clostridia bacterium]|nr:ABC transporter permease [Clostridia bacterium]MCL6522487.1 ABC transporter permease [Bacillota bacterium]